MRTLFAGIAAFLLLAAPLDPQAWAQIQIGSDITHTRPDLGTLRLHSPHHVREALFTVGDKIQFELTVTPAVTVTGTPRVRLLCRRRNPARLLLSLLE